MSISYTKYLSSLALLGAATLACTSIGAQAQSGGRAAAPASRQAQHPPVPESAIPLAAAGEVIVRLVPNASISSIAQAHGLTVKKTLRHAPNTHVLSGVRTSLEHAVAVLRQTPGVQIASPNHYFRPAALPVVEPNDPALNEQWALSQLGARNVWGITVGERFVDGPRKDVLVGLVDFGPDLDHPDLQPVFDTANAYDFVADEPYDGDSGVSLLYGHGTQVASCIAAVNNNGTGIASLPWEAVTLLPCNVGDFVVVNNVPVPVFVASAVVDAIYYSRDQGADIINLSFTLPTPDAQVAAAINEVYNDGVVVVTAAGNDRIPGSPSFDDPAVSFPGSLDSPVIVVGAVGRNGERAYYSNGGPELDLMAPGGNDPTFLNPNNRVLVADTSSGNIFNPAGPGYAYAEGTSLSAGYVSGLLATLISQGAVEALDEDPTAVPSDRVDFLRSVLTGTARNPFGRFTKQYGFGVVSADAALKRVTQWADITSPEPNEITASFGEPFRARIVRPAPGDLTEDDFVIIQNGEEIFDAEILDAGAGTILYRPEAETAYQIGVNSLDLQIEHPVLDGAIRSFEGPAEGRIPARSFTFQVRPHIEYPGLKMFSVPYELTEGSDSLAFLFGGNLVRLARWLPVRNRYAIWDIVGSPQDPEASLTTDSAGVARPPIGIGYWARVVNTTQTQLLGESERAGFYVIPVRRGWNMLGNPYPFRVSWKAVSVRRGNEVLSVAEAAERGWMRPMLWRYLEGRYQFQRYETAELIDWESQWLLSFQDLELIVPRVPSASRTSSTGKVETMASNLGRGWSADLQLVADGAVAGEVKVGAAARARNGFGPEDVETPPPALAPANIRIANRDWGAHSGHYAWDLRDRSKKTQSWTVEVETSEPGTPVKLTWDAFPAHTEAYLKVPGSSKLHKLTRKGSVELTPAQSGVQRLSVVAKGA
ncbi:MAG: S8 family serine peptidase [Armatimonadota bacterium]